MVGICAWRFGERQQIATNKVKGARAAPAWNNSTATLARQHNDANIVAVYGRQHTVDHAVDEATALIEDFLQEPFSNDDRHKRRIGKIAAYDHWRGRGVKVQTRKSDPARTDLGHLQTA